MTALKAFEASCQHRSFTAAARALHVTQGAVSRQVKQLEEQLGKPLFIRGGEQLQLTESAQLLAPQLSRLLDQLELMLLQALEQGIEPQRLEVQVAPTFATRWLAPRMADLCRELPELSLIVNSWDERQILLDKPHCTIRFGDAPAAGDYTSCLLMLEHLIAVAPPSLNITQIDDISRYPCLHVNAGRRLENWHWWLQAAGAEPGLADRGPEFSTQDQLVNACLSGAGVAVVDRAMVESLLAQGQLVALGQTVVSGPNGYWLDVPRGYSRDPGIASFSRWLLDNV